MDDMKISESTMDTMLKSEPPVPVELTIGYTENIYGVEYSVTKIFPETITVKRVGKISPSFKIPTNYIIPFNHTSYTIMKKSPGGVLVLKKINTDSEMFTKKLNTMMRDIQRLKQSGKFY